MERIVWNFDNNLEIYSSNTVFFQNEEIFN